MMKESNRLIVNMKHTSTIENREIWIEEFDDESLFLFNYYIGRLKKIDIKLESKKPIKLIISSYGGNASNCLSMISTVEQLKREGYEIHTVSKAKAMSAGFFLGMCGTKGHRYADKYIEFMLHDARNFQYGTSTHADKKRDYEESKKLTDLLISLVEEHTRITKKQFTKYIDRKQDWYMFSDEALELGIIDHIL